MKLRKILSAALATVMAIGAMAVAPMTMSAAAIEDTAFVPGKIEWGELKISSVDGVDYSKVASADVSLTSTGYAKGCVAAKACDDDWTWTQEEYKNASAGDFTATLNIDGMRVDIWNNNEVIYVKVWSGENNTPDDVEVTANGYALYDADGNCLAYGGDIELREIPEEPEEPEEPATTIDKSGWVYVGTTTEATTSSIIEETTTDGLDLGANNDQTTEAVTEAEVTTVPTEAAGNAPTGNAPIALVAIPVALAALVVVAKRK